MRVSENREGGTSFWGPYNRGSYYSQRLHYPLIKEYTLNHIWDPYYNLRYIPKLRGNGVSGFRVSFSAPRFQKRPNYLSSWVGDGLCLRIRGSGFSFNSRRKGGGFQGSGG